MLEMLVLVRGRTGFTVSVVEVLLVTRLDALDAYRNNFKRGYNNVYWYRNCYALLKIISSIKFNRLADLFFLYIHKYGNLNVQLSIPVVWRGRRLL